MQFSFLQKRVLECIFCLSKGILFYFDVAFYISGLPLKKEKSNTSISQSQFICTNWHFTLVLISRAVTKYFFQQFVPFSRTWLLVTPGATKSFPLTKMSFNLRRCARPLSLTDRLQLKRKKKKKRGKKKEKNVRPAPGYCQKRKERNVRMNRERKRASDTLWKNARRLFGVLEREDRKKCCSRNRKASVCCQFELVCIFSRCPIWETSFTFFSFCFLWWHQSNEREWIFPRIMFYEARNVCADWRAL